MTGLVAQNERLLSGKGPAAVKERDARVAQLEGKLLELQTELTQTSAGPPTLCCAVVLEGSRQPSLGETTDSFWEIPIQSH